MPAGRLSMKKKYQGTLTKKDRTGIPVTIQYEADKKGFVVRGEGGVFITKAKSVTEIRRGGYDLGVLQSVPEATGEKTVYEKLQEAMPQPVGV